MDTSVKRTLGSVPLVSVLKRFDCIMNIQRRGVDFQDTGVGKRGGGEFLALIVSTPHAIKLYYLIRPAWYNNIIRNLLEY